MLLSNAHVEGTLREKLAEVVKPRAARHGRRDADHGRILPRKLAEGIGEHGCVGGGAARRLFLGAGGDVELCDAVHAV